MKKPRPNEAAARSLSPSVTGTKNSLPVAAIRASLDKGKYNVAPAYFALSMTVSGGASKRYRGRPATVWGAESVLIDEISRCRPEHQNRLFSLVHDLTDTFLAAIGLLDVKWYETALNTPTIWRTILWILYGLYFLFFFFLFPKATGASQRLKPAPAILIGVLSYLVYQGVFFIFNR